MISEGGISVGLLQPEDIAAFRQVSLSGMADFQYYSDEQKQAFIAERTPDYYQQALANPDGLTLLAAKSSGNIAGVLEGRLIEMAGRAKGSRVKEGYVDWIYVEPGNRRRGLAERLYQEYERILREKSINWLTVGIDNANTPSLNLHKKVGVSRPRGRTEDRLGTYYFKILK